MEVFESLWMGASDVIVSLPTGYGKSVISHLCGRVLRRKPGVEAGLPGMTLVVVPLNIIQADQQASLAKHGIRSCTLDVKGNPSCVSDEFAAEGAYDKVNLSLVICYFLQYIYQIQQGYCQNCISSFCSNVWPHQLWPPLWLQVISSKMNIVKKYKMNVVKWVTQNRLVSVRCCKYRIYTSLVQAHYAMYGIFSGTSCSIKKRVWGIKMGVYRLLFITIKVCHMQGSR